MSIAAAIPAKNTRGSILTSGMEPQPFPSAPAHSPELRARCMAAIYRIAAATSTT